MNRINLYIFVICLLACVSCKQREQDVSQKALIEEFTSDDIDIWINLYLDNQSSENLLKDSKSLITDLSKESPLKVETFVKSIANNERLFTRYPTIAASIVAYAYGIDIPNGESSEIANRLLTFTRLSGKKSPLIEGLNTLEGVSATIVLFYDGSCGICQHILEDLATNYDQLIAKNVRIVTISADGSKDQFERNIKKYPWADKLCDYQSFNSVNFKRFGIAATPTMFVIDKNGIVVSEFDDLKETGLL